MDIRRILDKALSGSIWRQMRFTFVITIAVFSLFALWSVLLIPDKPPEIRHKEKPEEKALLSTNQTSGKPDNSLKESIRQRLCLSDADTLHKNPFNTEISGRCSNRYWGMISQFLDPGNIDKADGEHRIFIALLAIAGSATLGGLFIATLSNGLERRVDMIKNGEIRYRLKRHTVIIGYDPYAVSIIKKNKNSEIVLFTSQNPNDVLKHITTFLDKNEEKKVIIYHGGRDSDEQIQELDLHQASELFILGEPEDSERDFMNWHCFTLIQKRLSQPGYERTERLTCHILLQHFKEFQLARNFDLEDNEKNYLEFRPINFHEEWSRLILSDISHCLIKPEISPKPLDMSIHLEQNNEQSPLSIPIPSAQLGVGSQRHLHLIVIGFGEHGKAFCAHAMRTLHFPNLSTTKITLIDPNIQDELDHFRSHVPGYESIYDISFRPLPETPFSNTTRTCLKTILNDDTSLPYIVVCLTEPDRSLAAGLNLPPAIYKHKVPVLIRHNACGDIAKLLQNPQYTSVRFWGVRNTKIFSDTNHQLREAFAESAHNTYRRTARQLGFFNPDAAKSKDYPLLPSGYQWSNRYLADSYQIKLMSAGFFVVKPACLYDTSLYQPVTAFNTDELNAMAQAEHARWVAERVIDGWIYGRKRDDIHKIHPDIAPWEQINEDTRKYDYVLVNNMLKDLAEMGYTVVRKITTIIDS